MWQRKKQTRDNTREKITSLHITRVCVWEDFFIIRSDKRTGVNRIERKKQVAFQQQPEL